MINSDRSYSEYHKCLGGEKRNSKYSTSSDWSDSEEMHLDWCRKRREQYCLYCIHKILIYLEILTMSITFFSPLVMLLLPNIYSSNWLLSLSSNISPTSTSSLSSSSSSAAATATADNKIVHKRNQIASRNFPHTHPAVMNNRSNEVYYEVKIIEICIKLLIFTLCLSRIYLSHFKRMLFCLNNNNKYNNNSKNNYMSYSRLTGNRRYKQAGLSKSISSTIQFYSPNTESKQSLSFRFFIDSLTVIVTFSFWLVYLSHWTLNNNNNDNAASYDHDKNSNYPPKSCNDLKNTMNAINPFRHIDTIEKGICDTSKIVYSEKQIIHLRRIALELSTNFISIHLFIQLTGILLINFKIISNWISRKYIVHVVRALDGVSHDYKIGSNNLKSIAIYIIQNSLIDFQPYDPIIVRQKRHSKYNQFTSLSDGKRHYASRRLHHISDDNSKEMTVLKHKAMNSLKSSSSTSNNNNNDECYPAQMVRASHDHHPLSCCPSNSSVTVASTENSKHQTDCTDSQPVVLDNEDDNDEGTEKKKTKTKNQRKSLETFDFLKMPDIYEQNVNAARRLKSEVSYAKYKRKCQLRLLILMNSLFSGAYGKADFIQNATESSSDNQLQKSSEYIFQKLFGPLSKYLRLTKQHTYHNRNMILNRLKIYLQYNMSAEAFLSIYFNPPNEFISLHYCHLSSSSTHPTCSQIDKRKIATSDSHLWECWRRKSQASDENTLKQLNKDSPNKFNINSDSHRQIYQTWKLRLCDPLRNASVYDGFRFELIRSNVKLFCCVKQCTLFEMIQARLSASSWWSYGFQYEYNHNNNNNINNNNINLLPSSTVETCIGSSENTAEIKL